MGGVFDHIPLHATSMGTPCSEFRLARFLRFWL